MSRFWGVLVAVCVCMPLHVFAQEGVKAPAEVDFDDLLEGAAKKREAKRRVEEAQRLKAQERAE